MLGRRTKSPSTEPETPAAVDRSGKGRPTPKRSEAERLRRARVKPAMTRKEQARRAREERRAASERRRQAVLSGDPKHLPRRDQGPVRAFVRDYVDGRRSVAEFFLFIAVGVLVGSLLPFDTLRVAAFYLWTIMLVVIIVDSFVLGFRLRSALRTTFPDESRKGAIGYGIMRSTQLRRLRLPKPRVKPGGRR